MLWGAAALAALPGLATCVLSVGYLASCGYRNQVEASIACLAVLFVRGAPLYPPLDDYGFHGLLYGPLLTQANALGYVLGGALGVKLTGALSGYTGILLLVLTGPAAGRDWRWAVARGWALAALAAIGPFTISDRADALLLLWAVAALVAVRSAPRTLALAGIALLAGSAADLKLHGPLYVVPALTGWWLRHAPRGVRAQVRAALLAGGLALAGFLLPFVSAQASLPGYLLYVALAGRHGLSVDLLLGNCAVLAVLWLPAWLTGAAGKPAGQAGDEPWSEPAFAWVLLGAQLLVALVGAKPGAGAYHLAPFVCAQSLLLQQRLSAAGGAAPVTRRARQAGLACCLASVLYLPLSVQYLHLLLRFDGQLREQRAQLGQLQRLQQRYPGVVMGVRGDASYPLTYLRPWLSVRGAVDYAALMDLKESGVSDAPLARALGRCQIRFIVLPHGPGAPFSLHNGYSGAPLLGAAVREQFAQRYRRLAVAADYDVYGCEAVSAARPVGQALARGGEAR